MIRNVSGRSRNSRVLAWATTAWILALPGTLPAAEELRPQPAVSHPQGVRAVTELLQASGSPTDDETAALDGALKQYRQRKVRDDFTALTDFLSSRPLSAWEESLRAQLGDEYYRTGHFSKALEVWETVWGATRQGSQGGLSLSAQHAAAELANLYARLGRMDQLRGLLKDLEGTQLMSMYRQKLKMAEDGLWAMDNRPDRAFRCGPLALDRIRSWGHPTNAAHPLIFGSRSTTNGMCLVDVARLSRDLGMNYQVAFRSPGAKVIVPSVVHWKVGHYAAIVREARGLFLSQDPTFVNDTWVSGPTLDEEASGYFLVPPGELPLGWRTVPEQEAHRIYGKGQTGSSDSDATGPYDLTCHEEPLECTAMPEDFTCHGMPHWDFNLMLVNQRISDTPIGSNPPLGPPIFFRFILNAEDNWMRNFPSWWGTTLGMNWSCNWGSFVQDDPFNPSATLRVYIEGGWLTFVEDPSQPGIFRAQKRNPGYIQAVTNNGMVFGYLWVFPDGTKRSYGYLPPSGGTNPRYWLMSLVIDAQGNSAAVEYDDNYPGKITAIVDALGQRTTFEYGLSDPGSPPPSPVSQGNVQFHWQLTKITDPFGRSASFQYQLLQDGAPPAYIYYLSNITDIVGMSSQFAFFSGWAVSSAPMLPSLTTPYGTTHFKPVYLANRNFGAEITDPEGNTERLFYFENQNVKVPAAELLENVPQGMQTENDFLWARNVAYWNKKAYAEGFDPNDYSKAVLYHFTHMESLGPCGPLLESVKQPLENRVWFNYPGQGAGWSIGTDDRPSKIGRVLDDGTTELWQFERDLFGNTTNAIDPVGRKFTYVYSTNGVDLLEVRMTRNGQNQLLQQTTYNDQHLPLTVTDAAGQTNSFTYNPRGQILTMTNPRNETTAFGYDARGYLIWIDGALPGTQDRSTFTYDAIGRPHTLTDGDGYTVTFDCDDLDRLTKVTFPDGTYYQITYDRLRPGTVRDRLGRITTYAYNSLAQPISITDPLGRVTRFDWCLCGALQSLTDPMGRVTSWQRDIQNRVIAKHFADGSVLRYHYERTASRLTRVVDEQNQIMELQYYADDSLKSRTYRNSNVPTPAVQFTYDPDFLRLATMQDGDGLTTYSYTPITSIPTLGAGHVASIVGPWPNSTILFGYDELGRTVSQTVGGVGSMSVLDAAGRLAQVTNALGVFNIAWDSGSERLSSVQYPNGQRTQFAYFTNLLDQRLQRITHYEPDNSVQSEFTYAYNGVGQITNWTQLQANVLKTWTASYDAADRLVGVSANGPSSTQVFTYAYDPADNRTLEQVDTARRDYYYNALNQLIAMSNGPVAGVSYQWDAANRLAVISNGLHRTEFSYDGFGRNTRITEKDSGTITSDRRFLWCGRILCEERDSSGGTTLKRFFSEGVEALAGADIPAGNYYYTRDHLGSLRELTDALGAVRAVYDYDPFGGRNRLTGDLDADFGFTGLYYHRPSNLQMAAFRNYDARLARWLSRDPLSETLQGSLYAYVHNEPIDRLDPLGLDDSQSGSAALTDLPPTPPSGTLDRALWDARQQVQKFREVPGKVMNWAEEKFAPKSVKVGPVNVALDKPEISVGGDAKIKVNDKDVVTVSGECGVGVTTQGGPRDDLFYVRWKVTAKTILSKIPGVGKHLQVEQSGEVKFGKTEFDPGAIENRNEASSGIDPSGKVN